MNLCHVSSFNPPFGESVECTTTRHVVPHCTRLYYVMPCFCHVASLLCHNVAWFHSTSNQWRELVNTFMHICFLIETRVVKSLSLSLSLSATMSEPGSPITEHIGGALCTSTAQLEDIKIIWVKLLSTPCNLEQLGNLCYRREIRKDEISKFLPTLVDKKAMSYFFCSASGHQQRKLKIPLIAINLDSRLHSRSYFNAAVSWEQKTNKQTKCILWCAERNKNTSKCHFSW